MAGYGRGHEPYHSNIAGLNGLPSDYEIALQQQQANQYDFQADLDMFTNTQFFDFDMSEVPETASPPTGNSDSEAWAMQSKFVDHQQQPLNINGYQPISRGQTQTQRHTYPQPYVAHNIASVNTTPSSTVSSPPTSDPRAKSESTANEHASTEHPHLEEASRMAAEEDKRRRNTAASARFRVKKKQREQALEKSAKEMTDRVTYLENRVATLEMENKLLKDLITEKKGVEADTLVADGAKKDDENKASSRVKDEAP